jgi:hypothetical protein
MDRSTLKVISTWLKIGNGAVGLIAAFVWLVAALSTGGSASSWNAAAALLTAIAIGAQGISALIDRRVPPSATWA